MSPSTNNLLWALEYTQIHGLPISPWRERGGRKWPLTAHGHLDATIDEGVIRSWWSRWPDASIGLATGERGGVVALDIDVRPTYNGHDALEKMGVALHAETPTAHTPGGGTHLLFAHPGFHVKTIAGALGIGLDIRGDGGSLILPPSPGRYWDPHLDLNRPLAPMPDWMKLPEPDPVIIPLGPAPDRLPLSRYGEAALDSAVAVISHAPAGAQRDTLNREVYGIAGLVGTGVIPAPLALEALHFAARRMVSHDPRRPWRETELRRMVDGAFADGLRRPRVAA